MGEPLFVRASRIEHFYDLGYAVSVTVENEYRAEFVAVGCSYTHSIDAPPRFMYQGPEGGSRGMVERIEDAEPFATGSVKWDGCINWTFNDHDRGCALHECDRDGLLRIGELLARIHDIAGEMLPTADFAPVTTREQREPPPT